MYLITAGTMLSIARVNDPCRRWIAHTTRKELRFSREERGEVRGSSGAVVFREGEWYLLTRWDRVKKPTPSSDPSADHG